MTKTLPRFPVISTEAKRSGEISLLNSPRNMEAGDLSVQKVHRIQRVVVAADAASFIKVGFPLFSTKKGP